MALSSLYPKPAYREFGDIDLYCVEGKDKFFSYLESVTEKKAVVGDCHTTYRCKNIPIEYHSRFVAINRFNFFFDYLRKRKSEKLDKTLKGIITSKELPWISTETSNFKTLPYTAAFVHLAYHTAVHLSRTIVLRHLCDWTLFLNTYKGKYDESLAAKVLEKTPYKDIAPILSNIAQKYLGLPAESVPEFCRNVKCNKISERVLDNIFSPFTVLPDKPTRKAVFWWKFKRFFFEHWKYKLVYKETSLEIMIRGGVPFLTTRIKRILKPLHI